MACAPNSALPMLGCCGPAARCAYVTVRGRRAYARGFGPSPLLYAELEGVLTTLSGTLIESVVWRSFVGPKGSKLNSDLVFTTRSVGGFSVGVVPTGTITTTPTQISSACTISGTTPGRVSITVLRPLENMDYTGLMGVWSVDDFPSRTDGPAGWNQIYELTASGKEKFGAEFQQEHGTGELRARALFGGFEFRFFDLEERVMRYPLSGQEFRHYSASVTGPAPDGICELGAASGPYGFISANQEVLQGWPGGASDTVTTGYAREGCNSAVVVPPAAQTCFNGLP